MSEEHPVIPTRKAAGELLRKMLLQELTIGEGPIGQMDMLSILASAADWLDEAVAKTATLTDAEREAIKVAESDYSDNDMDAGCWQIAATLRRLLERLK